MRIFEPYDLFLFALCKIILNKFDWVIWQGLSALFELSNVIQIVAAVHSLCAR